MTAPRAATLDAEARGLALAIRGILSPKADPSLPEDTKSLVLLGPGEPRFWQIFQASDEYRDGARHPLDRWSRSTIDRLAARWGGTAIYPYDGPPWPPFLAWAADSGQAWLSPTGLLVHDTAGLFLSFRGAIALPVAVRTPPAHPAESPCAPCPAPCATACPVGALVAGQPYDVPRCRAHVRSPQGTECREGGCLVRRACPVSQRFGRRREQSAFHMAAFVPE